MDKRFLILKKYILFVIVLILGAFFIVKTSRAQGEGSFVLDNANVQHDLMESIEVLLDEDKTLSFEQISSPAFESVFERNNDDVLITDGKSAYWVRLRFRNELPSENEWLLDVGFPFLTQFDYYRNNPGGEGVDHVQTGSRFPFNTRDFKHNKFIFRVFFSDETVEQIVYMRIESELPTTVTFELSTPAAFSENNERFQFLVGLFVGILMMSFGSSVFIYISLKDMSYLSFAGLTGVLFLSVLFLYGYGQQIFWPAMGWWNGTFTQVIQYSLPWSNVIFVVYFLDTKKHAPRWDLFLRYYILGSILLLFFAFFSNHPVVLLLTSLFQTLFLPISLITGIYVYWKGYPPARIFVVATFAPFLVFASSTLRPELIFTIPVPSDNFTLISRGTSISIMVLLFSFALADKFRFIRLQRELALREVEQARSELEIRVEERTADLRKSNEDLQSFSYSVSHDLQAPLRAIDGFSRILLAEHAKDLSDSGKRYLGLVLDNSEKMRDLIDDLLAFSRLGRKAINLQPINMNALFDEVWESLSPQREGRNVSFAKDDLPFCRADRALLHMVLVNLLSNAIKFTGNRESAEITVSSLQQSGSTGYSIKDNGAGFEMEYAGKIFGIFQRLHRDEEFEGNGVGLATVRRIITKHGGEVWAEAEPGKGATFYFTLPNSSDSL